MWLGKKIASRQKEAERPVAGTISGEQNGGLLLQSSSEYREVAAAGPYGVKSLPSAWEWKSTQRACSRASWFCFPQEERKSP